MTAPTLPPLQEPDRASPRPVLLLALFAALCVIAGASFLWFRADHDSASATTRVHELPEPSTTAIPDAHSAPNSASPTLEAATTELPTRVAGLEPPPEGKRWLTGHLRIPPDTPKDTLRISAIDGATRSKDATADIPEDGQFRLAISTGMRWGTFQLESNWLALQADTSFRVSEPEPHELDASLGGRLIGRFVAPTLSADARSALVGTPLWIVCERNYMALLDSDFEFEFAHVPKYEFTHMPKLEFKLLRTFPRGFQPVELELPEIRPGKTTEVEVALVPAPSVAGLVIDVDGRPIQGAEVKTLDPRVSSPPPPRFAPGSADWAEGYDEQTELNRTPHSMFSNCTTSRAGEFELSSLPEGDLAFLVEAQGFFPAQKTVAGLVAGEERGNVHLQLSSRPLVSLKVVDAHNEPVNGASIFAVDLDHGTLMEFDAPGKDPRTKALPRRLQTAFDGKASSVASWESSRVCFQARLGNSVGFLPGTFRLERDQRVDGTIVVQAGTILLVRALDTADLPVNAEFLLEDADGIPRAGRGFPAPELPTTDPRPTGTPLGPLPPGHYTLTAIGRNDERLRTTVLIEGTPTQDLLLHFTPSKR